MEWEIVSKVWYKESFGEDYLLVYNHRDDETAEKEIALLLEHITLKPNAKVLDLCCGNGRHSRALARRGYQVTGVDLSEHLLKKAAAEQIPGLRYLQCDMRFIPFDHEFDAVFNLFTSFGYFDNDKDNQMVIKNVWRALKENGQFVMDYLNPDYVKETLVPYSEKIVGQHVIKEIRKVEKGYVKKQIVIEDDTRDRCYEERVKLYSCDEIRTMFENAGLTVVGIYGDYDFSGYHPLQSKRMILYAKK